MMVNVVDIYLALPEAARDLIWKQTVTSMQIAMEKPHLKSDIGNIKIHKGQDEKVSTALESCWAGSKNSSGVSDITTIGFGSPLVTKDTWDDPEYSEDDTITIDRVYELHPDVLEYIQSISPVTGVARFQAIPRGQTPEMRFEAIASNTLREIISAAVYSSAFPFSLTDELASEATLLCAGDCPLLSAASPLENYGVRSFTPTESLVSIVSSNTR
jgi:hypothetical protein